MSRNIRKGKFYQPNVSVGADGYNPQIINYYNSSDELIKIEEIWRGTTYSQTISGTGITTQSGSYTIVYDPWVEL